MKRNIEDCKEALGDCEHVDAWIKEVRNGNAEFNPERRFKDSFTPWIMKFWDGRSKRCDECRAKVSKRYWNAR